MPRNSVENNFVDPKLVGASSETDTFVALKLKLLIQIDFLRATWEVDCACKFEVNGLTLIEDSWIADLVEVVDNGLLISNVNLKLFKISHSQHLK